MENKLSTAAASRAAGEEDLDLSIFLPCNASMSVFMYLYICI